MNKNKIATSIIACIVAVTLGACAAPEDTSSTDSSSSSGGDSKASKSKSDNFTPAQKNAIAAAKGYLDLGTGFSRFSLIRQLTSKAGSGFKRKDAVFAVNQIKPNWNKQALLAAKGYLDLGTGFSRDGLLRQLTSKAGSGFTQAQAERAVAKVGL